MLAPTRAPHRFRENQENHAHSSTSSSLCPVGAAATGFGPLPKHRNRDNHGAITSWSSLNATCSSEAIAGDRTRPLDKHAMCACPIDARSRDIALSNPGGPEIRQAVSTDGGGRRLRSISTSIRRLVACDRV